VRARTLYLAKKTGTYADALAAFGLGRLMYLLTGEHPTIEDEGWCYAVSRANSHQFDTESLDFEAVRHAPGYLYVRVDPTETDAPAMLIDYPAERERLLNHRKLRDQLYKERKGKLTEEDRERLIQMAPRPNWPLYQNLRVLQAYNAYNSLHRTIRESEAEAFSGAVRAKLEALAEQNDVATAATHGFDPRVSAVQAFTPTAGKGTNRPKPDGASLAGLPASYVDWFEEWLRYIGVNDAARSTNIGDDIKLMVMAPGRIDGSYVAALHDEFCRVPQRFTSAKSDIITVLGLAQSLIKRSGLVSVEDTTLQALFSEGGTPRDVVAGLQIAYFTSLGSAKALTNLSFIGLPGWFPVTQTSSENWLAILTEHQAVLGRLDESHSEEAALLLQYRDFLSAGDRDTRALLRFFGTYAVHVGRQQGRGVYVQRFTTDNLRRLMTGMDTGYSEIVDNPGFRALAAAMRRATVTEQYWKSQGHQSFEIHYGLFASIMRAAEFPDQLVSALAVFVHQYDAENARHEERLTNRKSARSTENARHRPRVTTEELDQFVRLIDSRKPQVVAMLLLAYASAREPREKQEVPVGTPEAENGLTESVAQ